MDKNIFNKRGQHLMEYNTAAYDLGNGSKWDWKSVAVKRKHVIVEDGSNQGTEHGRK